MMVRCTSARRCSLAEDHVAVELEHGAACGLAAAADQRERERRRASWLPPFMPLQNTITVLSSMLLASPSVDRGELAGELGRPLRVPPADRGEAVVAVACVLQAVVAADLGVGLGSSQCRVNLRCLMKS